MTGVNPTFKHGPVTYEVLEAIKGGQLVEARTTGDGDKVGVAAAGSLKVLGVANTDARPAAANTGTTSDGFPFLDISGLPSQVTVDDNCYIKVKYAADAEFGVALIAAALGTVTPAGAAPDARTIVGYCAEPGGVTANATALARIIR